MCQINKTHPSYVFTKNYREVGIWKNSLNPVASNTIFYLDIGKLTVSIPHTTTQHSEEIKPFSSRFMTQNCPL